MIFHVRARDVANTKWLYGTTGSELADLVVAGEHIDQTTRQIIKSIPDTLTRLTDLEDTPDRLVGAGNLVNSGDMMRSVKVDDPAALVLRRVRVASRSGTINGHIFTIDPAEGDVHTDYAQGDVAEFSDAAGGVPYWFTIAQARFNGVHTALRMLEPIPSTLGTTPTIWHYSGGSVNMAHDSRTRGAGWGSRSVDLTLSGTRSATEDDMVLVNKLNIAQVKTTSPVEGLGLDADGFVVVRNNAQVIRSFTENAPPSSPSEGDVYLVPAVAPEGAWATKANQVATRTSSGWSYVAPVLGETRHVLERSYGHTVGPATIRWDGTVWEYVTPALVGPRFASTAQITVDHVVPTLIGSMYLPIGVIHSGMSVVIMGSYGTSARALFQVRNGDSGAQLLSLSATGPLAEHRLGASVTVHEGSPPPRHHVAGPRSLLPAAAAAHVAAHRADPRAGVYEAYLSSSVEGKKVTLGGFSLQYK